MAIDFHSSTKRRCRKKWTFRSFTLDSKWIINDAMMTLMKYFYCQCFVKRFCHCECFHFVHAARQSVINSETSTCMHHTNNSERILALSKRNESIAEYICLIANSDGGGGGGTYKIFHWTNPTHSHNLLTRSGHMGASLHIQIFGHKQNTCWFHFTIE